MMNSQQASSSLCSSCPALEAEIERLKAIHDAAFHVVMQWSSGTEGSTDEAISALEALFQTTEG